LNPEELGMLWLKASATWGIILAEGLHDWGHAPFELYPGICLTAEEKHGKLSQGSRIVLDTNCCVDLDALLGVAST
jgi:hypothetical protein